MLHIKTLDEGLNIFKALGSEIRLEIIKLLLTNPNYNMNELASKLNITNGALTSHIKKLEDCGIIATSNEYTGHGNQKKYFVCIDKLLIDLALQNNSDNIYQAEIKVGHYCNYEIHPTCALASPSKIIGEVDDARYFAHPEHYNADILWFTQGYVEYIIPNFIPISQKIDQISISAELSSEAPGYNDIWPSDIHFYINDTYIGKWTSPGDFGNVRGIFTPDWWPSGWNQYGLLKMVVINEEGTFIDGTRISDINIHHFNFDYKSTIKFKLAVPNTANYVGGLTIFGRNFGNYNQDINVQINYSPMQ